VEVLDRGVLGTLEALERGGQRPVLPPLIHLFLRETPSELAALEEAVVQEDASRVEDLAHRLKSGTALLGATRMSSLCASLQRAGQRAELGEAAAQVAQLRHEFARVRAALEALLPAPDTG
jgi:HPt (histidine-containing phosphotransfer) domain-containing protein